jgi:hypothetical protein
MLLEQEAGAAVSAETVRGSTVHRRYLAVAALFFLATLGAVLGFNIIVDPLWYDQGNRITGDNFGFDERLSKTLRFLNEPTEPDCVFFGSSRGTVLDAHRIAGSSCFNYAVAGATLAEMKALARYVRAKGAAPKRVIVGVDNFEFSYMEMPDETPVYISRLEDPPSRLSRYLSLDTAVMAFKALAGDGDPNRRYTADFENDPPPPDGSYRPETDLLTPPAAVSYGAVMLHGYGPFFPAKAAALDEFRTLFPGAALIGYATPVSAWQILRELKSGHLGAYIDSIYDASRRFDRFIDFSIPSAITENPLNTRDGSHFSAGVNDRIAEALGGQAPSFGILVTGLGREAYRAAFLAAARGFEQKLAAGTVPN